jgi:phosphohistidine phosphatase SixA
MTHWIAIVLLLMSLIGDPFGLQAAQSSEPQTFDVRQLRLGGYILFVRHPQTHKDQADIDPLHLDNVQAQRQLTDEGRSRARQLGELLRAMEVPVGEVIASKFFRAQETAKLIDVGNVTTSVDVTEGGLVVSPAENERRAAALRKLLTTPPPQGSNRIIVSHRPNLQDAAGREFGDFAEAELAVFRPTGDAEPDCVGRFTADAWSQWTP